jgi:hypothetical protein
MNMNGDERSGITVIRTELTFHKTASIGVGKGKFQGETTSCELD